MNAASRRWLFLLLVLAALLAPGCHGSGGDDSSADNTGAVPTADKLPPLKLTDNTGKLLLTWIDKKGDFHVVQKVTDVPKQGRGAVRVVETNSEDGTGQLVYVANLTKKRSDGTYPVKTMTRAAWDDKGASLTKSDSKRWRRARRLLRPPRRRRRRAARRPARAAWSLSSTAQAGAGPAMTRSATSNSAASR